MPGSYKEVPTEIDAALEMDTGSHMRRQPLTTKLPRPRFALVRCAVLGLLTFHVATRLGAQEKRPALEITAVTPVRTETHARVFFADFGQDAYGKLRLVLPEKTPSGSVVIRLGEKLGPDGAIDRHPPGSVSYLETTLLTSAERNVYEPAIPTKAKRENVPIKTPPEIGQVTPFRYVEIEDNLAPLNADSVRQLFVHAAFNDDASALESSDPTLNAVWALCKHTMKATTAFGVYIDGDRERKPYEADAYLNYLSHMACDANPSVGRFSFEYLLAHPTWPTEWSFHMVMLAAADYDATGDPVLAARNYDALKKKLLLEKARPDGLLRAPAIVDWPPAERDQYDQGDPHPSVGQMIGPEINTVANAFYYRALRDMARLADAVNRPEDARELAAKAQQVAGAFNAVFFDRERGVYIDGEGSRHASLHANLFPLAFGLVPEERQAAVADFIESRGMACSVYGAQYLLEALYTARRGDAAAKLLTTRDLRGWQHMIDLGSTMTLEAWDPRFKPNLTWNHAWGAAPANLLTRFVLGVRPLEPGYRKILIAPQPGPLAWVRGKVPTVRGPVGVSVRRGPRLRLDLDIPAGTTARVELPLAKGGSRAGAVTLNGAPVAARLEKGVAVIDPVPAGRQTFEMSQE